MIIYIVLKTGKRIRLESYIVWYRAVRFVYYIIIVYDNCILKYKVYSFFNYFIISSAIYAETGIWRRVKKYEPIYHISRNFNKKITKVYREKISRLACNSRISIDFVFSLNVCDNKIIKDVLLVTTIFTLLYYLTSRLLIIFKKKKNLHF